MLKLEVSPRGSAYLSYREGHAVAAQISVVGGASGVVADVNTSGEVIGIAIADVTIAENVERARSFAQDHRLPFPRTIDVPERKDDAGETN